MLLTSVEFVRSFNSLVIDADGQQMAERQIEATWSTDRVAEHLIEHLIVNLKIMSLMSRLKRIRSAPEVFRRHDHGNRKLVTFNVPTHPRPVTSDVAM